MTLEADRVREYFERRYRERFKRLRAQTGNSRSVDAHIREQRREYRAQRDRFIDSKAFGRVLAALRAGDASIECAARIVGWLCYVDDHSELRSKHHPAEAVGRYDESASHAALLESIDTLEAQIRGRAAPDAEYAGTVALALLEELRGLVPFVAPQTEHRWATRFESAFLREAGGAHDAEGAWRGLLVRQLAAMLPEGLQHPFATVAELLSLARVKVERQHVRSILSHD